MPPAWTDLARATLDTALRALKTIGIGPHATTQIPPLSASARAHESVAHRIGVPCQTSFGPTNASTSASSILAMSGRPSLTCASGIIFVRRAVLVGLGAVYLPLLCEAALLPLLGQSATSGDGKSPPNGLLGVLSSGFGAGPVAWT